MIAFGQVGLRYSIHGLKRYQVTFNHQPAIKQINALWVRKTSGSPMTISSHTVLCSTTVQQSCKLPDSRLCNPDWSYFTDPSLLAIMINRLTINLHQQGKRTTPLVPTENSQYHNSTLPTWIINIQNSNWTDMTEEPRNFARQPPITYDGTNGVELLNIPRPTRWLSFYLPFLAFPSLIPTFWQNYFGWKHK